MIINGVSGVLPGAVQHLIVELEWVMSHDLLGVWIFALSPKAEGSGAFRCSLASVVLKFCGSSDCIYCLYHVSGGNLGKGVPPGRKRVLIRRMLCKQVLLNRLMW